jgi:hypothetical protein
MICLSTAAFESMGFRDEVAIEATFHSVNVYSLSGVECSPSTLEHTAGRTMNGNSYQIAIGFSVNEICKKLLGDTLVEDETKWAEERRCSSPYLLVEAATSPAKRIGRAKDEAASITTYDMFSAEKAALSKVEEDVLPRAVTAVSKLLQTAADRCVATHITREVFGLTSSSRPVHDIRFSLSATASTSRHVSEETIRLVVEEAPQLGNQLDPKVATFLRLAKEEHDPLRRFLFFFLAVEIETHRTFAAIDHPSKASGVLDSSLPNYEIAASFLQGQPERLKNLKDRFIWCAMFAWPGMTTADIEGFAQLKSVRDRLSHGEITTPPPDAVASIETLALKLQRYRIPPAVIRRIAPS